jgi:hypothetical protein
MSAGASAGVAFGSLVALTDRLLAAHTQLIAASMRLWSPASRAHRNPTADAIEARAYEIFVERGGAPGNPVDDWRRAEAELRGRPISN